MLDVNTNKALVLSMERKISKEYIADIPPQKYQTNKTKTPQNLQHLNLTQQSHYTY